jgi:SAM-dependent methyltransferase
MATDPFRSGLEAYAKAVRDDLRANPGLLGDGSATELLIQPQFKSLVERLLPVVFPSSSVHTLPKILVEYSKKSIGRPDIAFVPTGSFARSFIELKEPSKSLNPSRLTGHDKEQFGRFCNLATWAFSNFHEIHQYARGELQQRAIIVPAESLDPDTSDAKATRLINAVDPSAFRQILETLVLAQPPVPKDGNEVAITIAYAARLVRDVALDIAQQLPKAGSEAIGDAMYLVREEFRDILYARPAAGGHGTDEDFNHLFAHAFAQTLAYGLLLARESSGADLSYDAHDKLDGTIHPLLKVTLQALLQTQIRDDLGACLDVLLDTVNVVDPAIMKRSSGYDPILYFYEDFLAVFDEKLRKRYGVFFTPVEVVKYQVAAVNHALRAELGTEGLLDESVLLLDPGCGTGTYLIAAANAAGEAARHKYGSASVGAEVRSLADRLFGFEILVGPYTVTHYRLHRELVDIGAKLSSRLHVYLADTLSPAHSTTKVTPHLGFMSAPIVKERAEADEVKSKTPILVVMGNPPYRRLKEKETNELVGEWVAEQLWEDFKKPVRDAGWANELNTFPDLYIAFYRWALWKLFERPGADGRGVLSFITNRTFLTGHPYAGVRKCLRERFDKIEIIDLRGDHRGARPAGVEDDENVFDIETGVCILTAYAGGAKPTGTDAEVFYTDVWEETAFARKEKLSFLEKSASDPAAVRRVKIARTGLDDFRPEPFCKDGFIDISQIFEDRISGMQTKRDDLVYSFSLPQLEQKITNFIETADPEVAKELFHESRDRKSGNAQRVAYNSSYVEQVSYRPFDIRFLYNAREYVDFPRPHLHEMWDDSNMCLYAMPSGTGAGPAVFVHGLKPDYHAFSNRGGYAFPLYDRRPGGHGVNVNPRLLARLSKVHDLAATAEDVFDFIIAVLSAQSYTRRFASDLEDAFPHVIFPKSADVFAEGVAVGKYIREIETFAKEPGQEFQVARLEGSPKDFTLDGLPPAKAWRGSGGGKGSIVLKSDGSLRVESVSEAAWLFSISGFQVIYKWLAYRKGQKLDKTMQRELLDLVTRVTELLGLLLRADTVLNKTVADPVPSADLGLKPLAQA